VTGNQIAAILVGLAVMFALERLGGFHWFLALALGALGYWSVRYAGYFVSERRYIKRKMQEEREAARRAKLP
jgi:hypothetical protein